MEEEEAKEGFPGRAAEEGRRAEGKRIRPREEEEEERNRVRDPTITWCSLDLCCLVNPSSCKTMTTPVLCRIVHQMHVCTQIHEGQRKLFVNVFNSLLIYFQFFWRIPFQEEDSSAVPVRPPPPPQFPPPPPPRLDFPSSFLFVSSPPPFPRGGSCYTAAAVYAGISSAE